MFAKPISELTLSDVVALVESSTLEGLQLDYKEDIDLRSDDTCTSFLEDVVAFANTAGGDIVIGVPEKRDSAGRSTGSPGNPIGIHVPSRDSFKLSVENLTRDRIEPRLGGLGFAFLPLENGRFVVVIRVPKSYRFHFVRRSKGWLKALGRNSAGNFTLDGAQIRDGILGADALPQRMAAFRQERLVKILTNSGPKPLPDVGKLVIHLIPEAAFRGSGPQIALSSRGMPLFKGPFTSLTNRAFNFDGLLAWTEWNDQAQAYLQVFRNSVIEGVETELGGTATDGTLHFNAQLDGYIVNGILRYLEAARAFSMELPIYVAVSIVGAKDYVFYTKSPRIPRTRVDRDYVALPEVELNDLDISHRDMALMMRPTFDILYQSFGHAGSWNYDADGSYKHELGGDYVGT